MVLPKHTATLNHGESSIESITFFKTGTTLSCVIVVFEASLPLNASLLCAKRECESCETHQDLFWRIPQWQAVEPRVFGQGSISRQGTQK